MPLRKNWHWWLPLVLLILILIGLIIWHNQKKPTATESSGVTNTYNVDTSIKSGCHKLVEKFCKDLWSESNHGDLTIYVGSKKYDLDFGIDQTGLTHANEVYLRAIEQAKEQLPKDLLKNLDYRDFFNDLEHYFESIEILDIDAKSQLKREELYQEVQRDWQDSLHHTKLERVEMLHKGYITKRHDGVPQAWKYDATRIQNELIAEVHQIIWKNSSAWLDTLEQAELVRKTYLEYLEQSSHLSKSTKSLWKRRIETVVFQPPNTNSRYIDDSCLSDTNAYYLPLNHSVTICPGYFQNGSVFRTVAHELSHAIGFKKNVLEVEEQTQLAQEFHKFKSASCSKNHKPTCLDWKSFKQKLPKYLDAWAKPEPQVQNLLRCLQTKANIKPLSPDEINKLSKKYVTEVLEKMASTEMFVNMIAPNKKSYRGENLENIDYLSPCTGPTNDPQTLNEVDVVGTVYVNEIRCSSIEDKSIKMKAAIEQARIILSEVVKRQMSNEGRFSSFKTLVTEGFAEDSEEHFADYMGQEVFAKLLTQVSTVGARRNLYFANIASKCDTPSLEAMFPKEFQVQKQYYFDPHSEAELRRLELLTPSIRSALECDKDFQLKECSL